MVLSESGRPLIFAFEAKMILLLAQALNAGTADAKAKLGELDVEEKIPSTKEAIGTIKGMNEDNKYGYPNDLIATAPEYVRRCWLVDRANEQPIDMVELMAELDEYDRI